MRRIPLLVALIALAGCSAPAPTVSPLRLPTRIPITPTPAPNPQVYYEKGRAYRAVGDLEKALDSFSQALAADPSFAPAYVERAALHLALEEREAALADAQAAIAADPGNATAYALLGEVLRLGFGDSVQALDAYEQAAQLDPSLARATFQVRWQVAMEVEQAGRLLALAHEYERAHPDDPMGDYYQGLALVAAGSPRAAIHTLVRALKEGGPAAVWFALGEAYSAEGAWSQAGVCYEQVRTLAEAGDPSFEAISEEPIVDLFTSLGVAYLYTGECTSARIMLEHALAVGAEHPQVQTLVGQAMICQTPTPTPTPYPWMSP
jgi:tetratricopeptide (TPR) repeat protein